LLEGNNSDLQGKVENLEMELKHTQQQYEEEKNNSTLNPSQEVIDRCEFFQDVAEYVDMYEEIWSEVRLAR
jgi:hypothetical protein